MGLGLSYIYIYVYTLWTFTTSTVGTSFIHPFLFSHLVHFYLFGISIYKLEVLHKFFTFMNFAISYLLQCVSPLERLHFILLP